MEPKKLMGLSPTDLDLLARALMLKALDEILLCSGSCKIPENPSLADVASEIERRVLKNQQPRQEPDATPF